MAKRRNAARKAAAKTKKGRARRTPPKASQYEWAIQEPFSPYAVGAKVPDFDSRVSATWRSCDYSTITTDGSGYACVVYSFSNPGVAQTTTATNTSGVFKLSAAGRAAWTDQSGILANSLTNTDSIRPVGGGLKLVPYQNATTAQGKVYLMPLSEHQVVRWESDTTGISETTVRRAAGSKTYSLSALASGTQKITFRSAPCDSACMQYVPSSLTYRSGAFGAFANMTAVAVVVIGGPNSTTVLDVEQVAHWEFLPGYNYEGLAGEATPYSPGVMERVSKFITSSEAIQDYGQRAADIVYNYLTSTRTSQTLDLMLLDQR